MQRHTELTFNCPHCGRRVIAAREWAGEVAWCGECAGKIQVPDGSGANPSLTLLEAALSGRTTLRKLASQGNYIGIDFGTTNCSMAWFNPRTLQAETLLNAEGEDKTPAVVYYGEHETLVGKHAEDRIEKPKERMRLVIAAKRELATSRVWRIGSRDVTPIDVAVEILKKLKHDAEEMHFHASVDRAVITHPAVFDEFEREKVREAGLRAGFKQVDLLDEPVAAAIAYTHAGILVGSNVLVYDLGGGTFDLAVLAREDHAASFRVALPPSGDRIGGEDIDRLIYAGYDERAVRKFGQPLCADGIDLHLLRQCRRYKENLSISEHPHPLTWWWTGKGRMELKLTRANFESLVTPLVDRTIQLTRLMCEEAAASGHPVDSIILIGGSSRIPLIRQKLFEALRIEPRKWQKQDVAVSLGAAYYAYWLDFPEVIPVVMPVELTP